MAKTEHSDFADRIDTMTDIHRSELDGDGIDLLLECGPDAADHPLVMDEGVLRFKPNPVVRQIIDRHVNLNDLWIALAQTSHKRSVQLGLRALYRDMGYSLSGYMEVFGEQLEEERNGK